MFYNVINAHLVNGVQPMHGTARAYQRPEGNPVLIDAAVNIIKYFSSLSDTLMWEHWERNALSGYRTMTPDGFHIEIRRMDGCVYGATTWRWRKYGFNPIDVSHWYHILIKNTRAPVGEKQVIDTVLLQTDVGYREAFKFHQSLRLTWRKRPARQYPTQSHALRLRLSRACQLAI